MDEIRKTAEAIVHGIIADIIGEFPRFDAAWIKMKDSDRTEFLSNQIDRVESALERIRNRGD